MAKTVVFDFGGVLVDWNPRYLYRQLLNSEKEVEDFLRESRFYHWNERADQGEKWADLCDEAESVCSPADVQLLRQFEPRFLETLSGPIPESVNVLEKLKDEKVPLYGLTNWSNETFPKAFGKFSFFRHFDGILVSGEEKLVKPDPKIFARLVEKFGLNPKETFFTDDNIRNVEAADKLGFNAHHFIEPKGLRDSVESWLRNY